MRSPPPPQPRSCSLHPVIRRHPAVVELVDEISDAIHQARRAVDRPADRVYLGQCYVETPDDEGSKSPAWPSLYARPQAHEVRCKVCSTEHPVAERRAWLLERAKDMIVTVKEASSYLGEIGGITVSQASIRGYVHRQKLAYRAPIEAKRFRLGDLLTVVMDESERRTDDGDAAGAAWLVHARGSGTGRRALRRGADHERTRAPVAANW
jgi:hypothetical protein